MTATVHTTPTRSGAVSRDVLRCLQLAARLLLEYNSRSAVIARHVGRLAAHLGVDLETDIDYRKVTLWLADGRHLHAQVHELRVNVASSSGALRVIDDLCADRIAVGEAVHRLEVLTNPAPVHGRAVLALIFGLAASALAWILHADAGAVAVSGVSSAVGLLARQALGRRHAPLFALPFTAALIGAVAGALVLAVGWTSTPGLAVIVPSLMLVPGPHLINAVHDVLDNHVQVGLSRLGLAAGILVAAACGAVLGRLVVLGTTAIAAVPHDGLPLNLPLDVVLAGVAACGFGAFYNASWRVLWISVACGMVGHGLRYVAMDAGISQEVATLAACGAIGAIARIAADRRRLPFSAIAFAGAVPMMPGAFIYESLAGVVLLSLAGRAADPATAAVTAALLAKAALVVGAMAIGLVVGAWLARRVTGSPDARSEKAEARRA